MRSSGFLQRLTGLSAALVLGLILVGCASGVQNSAGIAARVRLSQAGVGADTWSALDEGRRTAALDALLESLSQQGDIAGDLDPDERRDLIRKAIIGILADLDPADPTAREYRRKLSAAL